MDSQKKLLIVVGTGLLMLVAIVGFVLVKRGQSDNNGSSQDTELVYYGLWEGDDHLKDVIEKYEEENPGITIKYTQKSYTQYEENIYEWLTDPQTTPDIVRINNTWTYKFQDRLSPLPPEIMSSSEYQETFYAAAFEDFMGTDGRTYAIPLEIDGLALYYNKDLFTEAGIANPPNDWDTFVETAKTLTKTDSQGQITQGGAAMGCSTSGSSININHSADILFALMLQSNVQMTNSDASEATFDSQQGQDSLSYYTNFVLEHKVWSCSLRNDLEMFSAGNLAMMFAPSWRVFDIISMNSSINFDVAKFPQLPANNIDVNYGMYWGEAVSAQSQNQLEAWKFVKYLSEQEQLKTMYAAESLSRTFGEPYSRKDLADELTDAPYVSPFIEMAPSMISWKMGDQQTAETAINKAISDVVDGRKSVKSALEEAAETVNSVLGGISSI
ncbi:MAG: extracellular solute-binding protein [Patescibacteria group bacterium]|nr:extracellular solute-binding protein [Patescibacteria group bacterium]